MRVKRILLQFLGCWFVFFMVSIGMGYVNLQLQKIGYKSFPTFSNYLFPIISYGIIYLMIIRKNIAFKPKKLMQSRPPTKTFVGVLIIALGLQLFNQVFVDLYHVYFFSDFLDFLFTSSPKITTSFWFSTITAIFYSPLFEEFLFRGYFFYRLNKYISISKAIILSSLFFSLVHWPAYGKLVPAFTLGCILSYVYWKSNTIIIPILLHVINNGLAIASTFYMKTLWKPIFDQRFTLTYWSIISLGLLILLMGIYFFEKSLVKEKPRENL